MNSLARLVPYARRSLLPITGGVLALVGVNYLQLAVARVVGAATDAMGSVHATKSDFLAAAVLIVGLTLMLGVLRYWMRMWIISASRDVEFEFRNDFFRKLQALTPSFYDTQRTGDLMSRATNDIEAVRMMLGPGILQFANSVTIFPLALLRMFAIDAWLSAVSLAPLVILPFLVNFFGNRVHRRSREVQDKFAEIGAMVQENLSGVRVVKAFAQEEAQCARFAGLNREFIDLNMRLARVQAAFFPSLRILTGVSVVLSLWAGALLVIAGTLTIGGLIEFSLIQVMLFWPLIALGWTVSLLQRGKASMDRLAEVLDVEPDIANPPAGAAVARGEIELRNLRFRYGPDLPWVLQEITASLGPGRRLGIVGPTGSGKSTIAQLLAHLYPVERGMIFVDGHDINDIPLHDLRASLSLVFQETFLFSDTIAANISFGIPAADPDLVKEAAEQARLAEEIEEFPHGYETMLGERGINLSGGQKQRSAIARALIRDPKILVLDDALSAVDTETEAHIIASLRGAMAGRTAVIIAHRISAVMECDEIIVLDGGRIIERGTHAALIARNGLYASLYQKQLLADAVETGQD